MRHESGVIHRGLEPANIKLTLYSGRAGPESLPTQCCMSQLTMMLISLPQIEPSIVSVWESGSRTTV